MLDSTMLGANTTPELSELELIEQRLREREERRRQEDEEDIKRQTELLKAQHDKLIKSRIPLKEEYDKQIKIRNDANAEIARVGTLIDEIDKKLGPTKTVSSGQQVITMRTDPLVKVAPALIKRKNLNGRSKSKTVDGVTTMIKYYTLPDDDSTVYDIETGERTNVDTFLKSRGF